MLKAATTATRSPRGTKPVSQAFFTALESIPEATRPAVEKAAIAMIRDEIKMRKEKMKAAAAKEKARMPKPEKPVAAKKAAKSAAGKDTPAPNGAAEPKRRGRKPANETVDE